jgi:hypothetical protein
MLAKIVCPASLISIAAHWQRSNTENIIPTRLPKAAVVGASHLTRAFAIPVNLPQQQDNLIHIQPKQW